jgi:hypothetical protein
MHLDEPLGGSPVASASLIVMRSAVRTRRHASMVRLYGETADHFSD